MKIQTLAMLMLAVCLLSAVPAIMAQGSQITAGKTLAPRLVQLKEKLVSRVASTQEIMSYQQEKLQAAAEGCSTAECQEKLQARITLVSGLKEVTLSVLQRLNEKKDAVIQELTELGNSTHFAKFKQRAKDFVARTVAQTKQENTRLGFEQAHEKYTLARQRLETVKANFNQTREQLQFCLENETEDNETAENETDDCQPLREQIRLHAQKFLNRTLDLMENHLEKVRSRVEGSETLTEEEMNETLAEIESKLAQIIEFREQVANITENASKEEIRNLTLEIRDMWKNEIKLAIQRAAGFVQLNKMGGVYVKMRHLERRLQNVLEKMAEQEKNTTGLEDLVDQFSAKLDEAETHYGLAQEKFREASLLNGSSRQAAIQEAQSYMNDTKRALKDAYQILKDIVREFMVQRVEHELEEGEAEDVLAQQEDALAQGAGG